MKKTWKLLFLLAICFMANPLFAASNSASRPYYVTLDPVPLKAKPSASSKNLGSIEYASAVYVMDTQKNWSYVCLIEDNSVQGWVPSTSLTTKKIKEKSKAASANADEIALAGKGWNKTIEANYSQEYELDFTEVDYVESFCLSDDYDQILTFEEDGWLYFEGDAK